MSTYSYCPRGGQTGIYITESEQELFAKNHVKTKYVDEYIPLPEVNSKEQLERIKKCSCSNDNNMNNQYYWETNKGSHGWCCLNCGKVSQWG